jgi:hypothetical protein
VAGDPERALTTGAAGAGTIITIPASVAGTIAWSRSTLATIHGSAVVRQQGGGVAPGKSRDAPACPDRQADASRIDC